LQNIQWGHPKYEKVISRNTQHHQPTLTFSTTIPLDGKPVDASLAEALFARVVLSCAPVIEV
jgi:hypothetical protein